MSLEYLIGFIGSSLKKHEKRAPLHPADFDKLPQFITESCAIDIGYFRFFPGYGENVLTTPIKVIPREEVLRNSKIVVIPKPTPNDLELLSEGQIVFGWGHCVQDREIVDVAIRNKLTLISWENIFAYVSDGMLHTFHANNSLAGFSAVMHTAQLTGKAGGCTSNSRIAIFGTGSTSNGATRALKSLCYSDIDIFTKRDIDSIPNRYGDVNYIRAFQVDSPQGITLEIETNNAHRKPLDEVISSYDIIVNCMLQDVHSPIMLVFGSASLKPGCMIIDISCDEGMGFPFAQKTTFDAPIITQDKNIKYYAVDNTPTYYWDTATRYISKEVLDLIKPLTKSVESWLHDEVISKATDIRNGVIVNQKITEFRKRND
ncbi:MAG: hypothetical protein GY746_05870 [Gammaproteobacteria bacterium]|nr:hypothetical protein [Gammaproteobacteria bacterium]